MVPWSHVSIKGIGHYRLCCLSRQGIFKNKEGHPLRVETTDWNSIFNNDRLKVIRKNMLAGKWSEECITCETAHSSGMSPRNIYGRFMLAKVLEPEYYPSYQKAKTLTQPDGSISPDDFPPSYLDIRFGNRCNLKCVMCTPHSSNKWYDDWSVITGKQYFHEDMSKVTLAPNRKGSLKPLSKVYEWSDNFPPKLLSQIEKYIERFRFIYIAGGEPLLIKQHYKFLHKIIKKGIAGKVVIQYNSNITFVPEYALETWKHFKQIQLNTSIDGFGKINDFIRYPSQWNEIETNLTTLNNSSQNNLTLNIQPAVSLLNISHLPEFIDFVMRKNFKITGNPEGHMIMPIPVHTPHHLNCSILEESFKKKIQNSFETYKKKISEFNWQSVCGESKVSSWDKKIHQACKILDNYIKFMYQTKYTDTDLAKWRSQFIYFMDKLDQLRGTNWSEVFPELYKHTNNWRNLPPSQSI